MAVVLISAFATGLLTHASQHRLLCTTSAFKHPTSSVHGTAAASVRVVCLAPSDCTPAVTIDRAAHLSKARLLEAYRMLSEKGSLRGFGSISRPPLAEPITPQDLAAITQIQAEAYVPSAVRRGRTGASQLYAIVVSATAQVLIAVEILQGRLSMESLSDLAWWQIPAVLLAVLGAVTVTVLLGDKFALGGRLLAGMQAALPVRSRRQCLQPPASPVHGRQTPELSASHCGRGGVRSSCAMRRATFCSPSFSGFPYSRARYHHRARPAPRPAPDLRPIQRLTGRQATHLSIRQNSLQPMPQPALSP
jgi:hypothetical protein